jgi:PEP-CTERM motif
MTGNMRWTSVSVFPCALLSCMVFFSSPVRASISYPDHSGTTVDFTGIVEDTNTGDTLPLFGAPNFAGDQMDFDPVGFGASSSGAVPPDQTDGNLKFMVMSKEANVIDNISFSEAGDTSLNNGFSNDDALTSVEGHVFIDILQIDNQPVGQVLNIDAYMTFTPSPNLTPNPIGDYQISVDSVNGHTYSTNWFGSLFVDLTGYLDDNDITYKQGVTKISVDLDNILTAASSTLSSAVIAKKDFDGLVVSVNVPEPASCVLACTGLVLLGLFGRRRQAG